MEAAAGGTSLHLRARQDRGRQAHPHRLTPRTHHQLRRQYQLCDGEGERANRIRGEERHVPGDVYELAARYALKTREESQGLRGLSPRFFEDAFSYAYTLAGKCVDLDIISSAVERTFEHQSMKDLNLKELLKQFEETRSEEHTSELQSHSDLVCRLLLEKKNKKNKN